MKSVYQGTSSEATACRCLLNPCGNPRAGTGRLLCPGPGLPLAAPSHVRGSFVCTRFFRAAAPWGHVHPWEWEWPADTCLRGVVPSLSVPRRAAELPRQVPLGTQGWTRPPEFSEHSMLGPALHWPATSQAGRYWLCPGTMERKITLQSLPDWTLLSFLFAF